MRVVYMGTPDIAVSVLEAIIEKGHEVAAVVTQPDKPKGRGRELQYPPVKEAALRHGIPVYQPAKIKNNPEIEEQLRELKPDIIVVAAYGQILPKSILEMAEYGCVNVHASLLPKYRGAAPIQRAIIDGESVTGVTTMLMDEGLDTGDMLDKAEVRITPEDTGGSLHDKLAEAGGRLITETMDKLQNGTAVRTKQDDSQSTYAAMLNKAMGNMDFGYTAAGLERLVRGLNPWPSAYTYFKNKTLKVWEAYVMDDSSVRSIENYDGCGAGQIVAVGRDYIGVKTADGVLCITQLQLEGKKRMDTKSFLMGVKVNVGDRLGKEEE